MHENTSQQTLIELFYGKGAHANPIASVHGISAELAGRRLAAYPQSISQILFHMNYWMEYELRSVRGDNPPYPAHAAESWPTQAAPASEADWEQTVARFAALIDEFSAIAKSDSGFLNREVKATHAAHNQLSGSVLAVLWQIVAHNSYHVGQIILLRRLLNDWPAEAGDTW
jgi:uncharacterized damage-inducible protein DinB